MKYMSSKEIRSSFLDFFRKKQHVILPSSSLIPKDPQLMFTVAGMVPFKPFFWGVAKAPHKRIATCQKCVRTVDIDRVGKTARHDTFFEMLGNFSFNDYFKKEAIQWAWEYVTDVLEMPEDLLWVSVYEDDDEAYDIWKNNIRIPERKIVRLDKEENWWGPVGNTGPCGPCSEIFVDTGRTETCPDPENCSPGCDCDRFLELWNLVFTEFNQNEEGKLIPLKHKNIDTGLGLERISAIMQNVETIFDTDLFTNIIKSIEKILDVSYNKDQKTDISIKIIADHSRSVSFLVTDGVMPSNEGRGYVLRRLIRRAVLHASLLYNNKPFLNKLMEVVAEEMGGIYLELKEKCSFVKNIVLNEEQKFIETLEKGTKRLHEILEHNEVLSGKELFQLYDTYGFPVELVEEIVQDKDVKIDSEGFKTEMKKQRERARQAQGKKDYGLTSSIYNEIYNKLGNTEFEGYKTLTLEAEIKYMVTDGKLVEKLTKGDEGELFFKETPFYAEKGGQVSDRGVIKSDNSIAVVSHVFIPNNELISHKVYVENGTFEKGQKVKLEVDAKKRKSTARNHTATHLLHAALRKVLGNHVRQFGSLVDNERLRFDFTHFSALEKEDIEKIEEIINEKILEDIPVKIKTKSLEEAKNEDITALFEEKYSDIVRVISINDFSKELCGGTHVSRTGEIGIFKIISESSVSSGVRRIEAVTGLNAYELLKDNYNKLNIIKDMLAVEDKIIERIATIKQEVREKEKEVKRLREKVLSGSAPINDRRTSVEGNQVHIRIVDNSPVDVIRNAADVMMQRLKSGIVFIFNKFENKVVFVVKVSEDLTDRFNAGKIAQRIARELNGGGGGRPDFAQAGGKNIDKIEYVVNNIEEFIND
ncbi:MAG: alanine--tRNA ligase [Thermotogota bacterium]|nr:alanine--tRNA ligase [Thermotogota bacterium]